MGLDKTGMDVFFNMFEMDADRKFGYSFKSYLKITLDEFIRDENKTTAFDVYNTFFDSYRLKLQGEKSFIDLLDVLKNYEERASTLLDKQRDHYVHSVNVFALGLTVYAKNAAYRSIFEKSCKNGEYNGSGNFSTYEEEFLFQWGMASLFHDIGYPVEITNKQFRQFIDCVQRPAGNNDCRPYLAYGDFEAFNAIADEGGVLSTSNLAASESGINPLRPLDLLSYNISRALGIDGQDIKEALDSYLGRMQQSSVVDHGYYSAILVLSWYGRLVQQGKQDPKVLFQPVTNAAAAILLHNYYKIALQKPPFNLPPLAPERHPLAYMLILCDELQEWNREAYGYIDKQRVLAEDSEVVITENQLSVHYITTGEKVMEESFATKKKRDFLSLLDMQALFPEGVDVRCTTKTDVYLRNIRKTDGRLLPRPLLENLEQMARKIHENYNKVQLERHPEKPLEYPSWEALPEDLKYSNVRQARSYFDKLSYMNYIATSEDNTREEVLDFTPEQIETLARIEHDSWWLERKSNGWTYGEEKDTVKKTSPYMLPYDELTEEIKELDRDAVRNIFPLLHEIGLHVYPAEQN